MKKIIFLLTLIFSIMSVNVFADENIISLSDSEVEKGEEFSVVLSITDIPSVIGSIVISYDNTALEVINTAFSDSFSNASTISNPTFAENKIKLNWMTLEEGLDFNNFYTIDFKAIKGGTSEIKIEECNIYDIDENEIELTIKNATVKVEGEEENTDNTVNSENNTVSPGTSSGSRPSKGSSSSKKPAPIINIPKEIEENIKEIEQAKNFTDIKNYAWAEEAINALSQKGIINGVSDTEFAPSAMIKRADFMCILVRMLELDAEFTINFDDVKADNYYYKELGIAKALGLTEGVGENKFLPEEPILRQDMFTIIHRLLDFNKTEYKKSNDNVNNFDDFSEISDYAKGSVSVLVENGLVTGSDNKIIPKQNTTRAETAVLVYRLNNFINKL